MTEKEQSVHMIGFRPPLVEYLRITFVAYKFEFTKSAVVRELIDGNWTLNELYNIARKTNPGKCQGLYPYIKATYCPTKSAEDILQDAYVLYTNEISDLEKVEDAVIRNIMQSKTSITGKF